MAEDKGEYPPAQDKDVPVQERQIKKSVSLPSLVADKEVKIKRRRSLSQLSTMAVNEIEMKTSPTSPSLSLPSTVAAKEVGTMTSPSLSLPSTVAAKEVGTMTSPSLSLSSTVADKELGTKTSPSLSLRSSDNGKQPQCEIVEVGLGENAGSHSEYRIDMPLGIPRQGLVSTNVGGARENKKKKNKRPGITLTIQLKILGGRITKIEGTLTLNSTTLGAAAVAYFEAEQNYSLILVGSMYIATLMMGTLLVMSSRFSFSQSRNCLTYGRIVSCLAVLLMMIVTITAAWLGKNK